MTEMRKMQCGLNAAPLDEDYHGTLSFICFWGLAFDKRNNMGSMNLLGQAVAEQ